MAFSEKSQPGPKIEKQSEQEPSFEKGVEEKNTQIENLENQEIRSREEELGELRNDLSSQVEHSGEIDEKKTEETLRKERSYKIKVDESEYEVILDKKEELFPDLGKADVVYGDKMYVREDLPPNVQKAVIAHETGHLKFRTNGEWLPRLYGIYKEPINSLKLINYMLTNKEQRQAFIQAWKSKLFPNSSVKE